MMTSEQILNAFRNKYYTDGNNTENGIVANAIDEILPEYVKLKRENTQGVKHGKWILKHIGAGHYWECSACNGTLICLSEGMNYCPYCGARMDGDGK